MRDGKLRDRRRFSDEELIGYISRHGVANAYSRVHQATHPQLPSTTNAYNHRDSLNEKSFPEDLGISKDLLLFLFFIILMYMATHFFSFFMR